MPLKTHNRKTYKHKKKRTYRHKKKRTSRHKKKRNQKKTYRHKKKRLTGGMDDEQAQATRAARVAQAQAQKAARGTKEGKAAQRKLWQAASLRPPMDWHASARGAVVPAAKRSGVSEAGAGGSPEGSCWDETFKEDDCCYDSGYTALRHGGPVPHITGTGKSSCWEGGYTYEKCCPWHSICHAAYVGDLEKIRTTDVDVAKSNRGGGETPMHYAAIADKGDAISLLVDKGFNVDAKDIFGMSALHYAYATDSGNAVSALKGKGAKYDESKLEIFAEQYKADRREKESPPAPATVQHVNFLGGPTPIDAKKLQEGMDEYVKLMGEANAALDQPMTLRDLANYKEKYKTLIKDRRPQLTRKAQLGLEETATEEEVRATEQAWVQMAERGATGR